MVLTRITVAQFRALPRLQHTKYNQTNKSPNKLRERVVNVENAEVEAGEFTCRVCGFGCEEPVFETERGGGRFGGSAGGGMDGC